MKGLKDRDYVVFLEDIYFGFNLVFKKGSIGRITLYDYDTDFIIVDGKGIPLTKKQLRLATIDEVRLWFL